MKAINGGLNLGSEFNPEKLCSEMKGISVGGCRDESHQWRVEPRV